MSSNKQRIIITGGSGFLGSYISEKLIAQGYKVVSLDIAPPENDQVIYANINLLEDDLTNEKLANPYAVINLAGKNIFGRWTEEFKDFVYRTRVESTQNLVGLFKKEQYRPEVLVSASASGFYGDRADEKLTDESSFGEGFLAKVCRGWEQAAREAEEVRVSTTVIRNGHILGEGGLLGVLLPYYQWGVGGPLSSGRQWFPWIHIEDIANLYIAAVKQGGNSNTVNAVAPDTVRNQEFSRILAEVLNRPHLFRIPKFALKLLYGEFGEEMLYSQRVVSKAEDKLDFSFAYPKLRSALKHIIRT